MNHDIPGNKMVLAQQLQFFLSNAVHRHSSSHCKLYLWGSDPGPDKQLANEQRQEGVYVCVCGWGQSQWGVDLMVHNFRVFEWKFFV